MSPWTKKPFFFARPGVDVVPPIAAADVLAPDDSDGDRKEHTHDPEKATSQEVDAAEKEEVPDQAAQEGIKKAEAVTLVWSRTSLIFLYFLLFLISFVTSLQQQITSNLAPFVVSDFQVHSLLPAVEIAAYIMSGVLQLPIAKILDVWGRSQGFAAMVALGTLGLVLKASCKNVETYAAAQVFYSVGMSGASYVVEVIIADTSTFKNRALAFAFTASPYIATTFAGPRAAESYLKTSGWRWAFGTFSIIQPIIALPIFVILYLNQKKAEKEGILVKEKSGRTFFQSLHHYFIEFDAIGLLLICGGLVLFLLPFSLAGHAKDKWRSANMIAMIVVGIVLLIAFVVYERYFVPKPFIPFHLLVDPTVIGACLLGATLFIAYFCWDGYYGSYLMVVHGMTLTNAGYIANIYSIGSCFWAILVGIAIRASGRFKWLAWGAVPVAILAGGLMIHFRHPNTDIGFVVMCQILIAFSGGTLVICNQMAAMSVSKHGDIAAVLALLFMFASIGGAIGSSISGAIWTNTLPNKLLQYLPAEAQSSAELIYGNIVVQLSFPFGHPVRDAVVRAYGDAQKRMCIAGTVILGSSFIWVWMWKDVRVADVKQGKGRLF